MERRVPAGSSGHSFQGGHLHTNTHLRNFQNSSQESFYSPFSLLKYLSYLTFT